MGKDIYNTIRHKQYPKGKPDNVLSQPQVLVLNRRQVQEYLNMRDALELVEKAFYLKARGSSVMPPKLYLDLPEYQGDFRAMPAYINGMSGLKWVSVYPCNRDQNLPCVMGTIILCDPNNGCLLAIMDGTYITSMRTGAAGGVAVKYLARKDSSVVGIVGAGEQARMQLTAINEVLPRIDEVKVYDLYSDSSARYVKEMVAKLDINIHQVESIEEAANADIVVTTTPSQKPVVRKWYIRQGTHINAIGADAPTKQELDSAILRNAKIIVDDIEQASHSGEINVPLSKGRLNIDDVYGTLGEIVADMKKGREDDQEITIFDSTGLAIQDIICAKFVYEKATKEIFPALELF
jgi:alanine dehydrogenase